MNICIIIALVSLAGFLYAQDTIPIKDVTDCVQTALEKSPYLDRFRSDRQQATVSVLQTINPVLPTLTASSGYQRSGPQNISPLLNIPGISPFIPVRTSNTVYSTVLTVNQSLVNIPAWIQIGQTVNVKKAAQAVFQGSLAGLAYAVKQVYYNLVLAYRNLAVSTAAVAQSLEQLEIAQARFQLGALSGPDLLKIQVGLSQSRFNLITAQTQLVVQRGNLSNLLGIPELFVIDTVLLIPDTSVKLPSEDSLITSITGRNPSILASDATLQIREANESAVTLSKIPTLGGSFTYGTQNSRFTNQFSDLSGNDYWQIGVQLTWSIFDGALWFSRRIGARADLTRSRAEVTIANDTTIQSIHQIYGTLRAAQEGIPLARDLVGQAQRDYQLTIERYRLGSATSVDILTSQLSYNQALQQSSQIIVNYRLAIAQLMQLSGEW